MSAPRTFPDSLPSWKGEVRKAGIGIDSASIHQLEVTKSASKITWVQYLRLRILWVSRKQTFFKRQQFGLDQIMIAEAEELLSQDASWNSYINYLESNTSRQMVAPKLGTFSLAKWYQDLVDTRPQTLEEEPNVVFGPKQQGTPGQSNVDQLRRSMHQMNLRTPSKKSAEVDEEFGGYSSDDAGAEDQEFSLLSEYSPAAKEAEVMYPQTKDEQIVNSALVLFLNALTVHHPLSNHWDPHRRSFTATFSKASYQARTDGYLCDNKDEKVRALIEVKPYIRARKEMEVRMQEGAQMAAWIADDKHRPKSDIGRHLLVSQDRQEIYLTFAEYDPEYVNYLKTGTSKIERRSFLIMREFGPWHIYNKGHMEHLGHTLLAFTMRASNDYESEASAQQGAADNKSKGKLFG